jgi:hypothetical protein
MNFDELLERWRHGELNDAELAELTQQLASREGRARLRQDWFLDASLPMALQAAWTPQTAPAFPPGWIAAWRAATTAASSWCSAWRWAVGLATLAVAAVCLWHLRPGLLRRPDSQPQKATVAAQPLGSSAEDLRDLALLIAEPPVPALNPPQAAWLAVLTDMTESHKK